jgi:hypothetical protein
MGRDFPQGNTVDLGEKYRLVIKVGCINAVIWIVLIFYVTIMHADLSQALAGCLLTWWCPVCDVLSCEMSVQLALL